MPAPGGRRAGPRSAAARLVRPVVHARRASPVRFARRPAFAAGAYPRTARTSTGTRAAPASGAGSTAAGAGSSPGAARPSRARFPERDRSTGSAPHSARSSRPRGTGRDHVRRRAPPAAPLGRPARLPVRRCAADMCAREERCAPASRTGDGSRRASLLIKNGERGGARSRTRTGTPAQGQRGLSSPCLHSTIRAGHGLRFAVPSLSGPLPRAAVGWDDLVLFYWRLREHQHSESAVSTCQQPCV